MEKLEWIYYPKMMESGGRGLYIHVPFCGVKCRFCHFATFPGLKRLAPRYLAALQKEMAFYTGKKIDTIFLGGGTPTVLEAEDLLNIFLWIESNFDLSPGGEATVECNPESVTGPKWAALKRAGVGRVSLGLQAAQDRLLRALGRAHTYAQFESVWRQARSFGFCNMNVDLMFGLPSQTLEEWVETIERVLELEPEHVSAYALEVEEQTAFRSMGVKTDEDLQAEMYSLLCEKMARAGYGHYEISNFAMPGFECRHNLKYWKQEPVLGLGPSAAGFENGIRWKNVERLEEYFARVENGLLPREEEPRLKKPEQIGEDLMLGLRLREGARVSAEADRLYGKALRTFRDLGFLIFSPEASRARLTREGWLVSNQIFRELLIPAAS